MPRPGWAWRLAGSRGAARQAGWQADEGQRAPGDGDAGSGEETQVCSADEGGAGSALNEPSGLAADVSIQAWLGIGGIQGWPVMASRSAVRR